MSNSAPLTITIPTDLLAAVGEVSHYLLTSYCNPFAIRDAQDVAMAECEAAERAQYPAFAPIEFRWMPQGDALRLHVRGSGSWDDTAYTVTRITVLAAGAAPAAQPPLVAPARDVQDVTPEIAANVLHHFGHAGGVEADEETAHLIATVASGGAAAIKSRLAEIEQATPGWFPPTADEVRDLQEIASRLRTP